MYTAWYMVSCCVGGICSPDERQTNPEPIILCKGVIENSPHIRFRPFPVGISEIKHNSINNNVYARAIASNMITTHIIHNYTMT